MREHGIPVTQYIRKWVYDEDGETLITDRWGIAFSEIENA